MEVSVKNFKFNIYSKILLLEILVIFIMSILVPVLLNYPPNSEAVKFQSQIEPITHLQQYILLGSLGIILYVIVIKILFKDIFKYIKKDKSKVTFEEVTLIRNQCFSIPKKIISVQIILLIVILLILFVSMSVDIKVCLKFLLIYFSFFTVIAIMSNVLIRKDLDEIIKSTYLIYHNYTNIEKPTKFYKNLLFNLLPFFIVIIITISMLGYSKVCNYIGESNYYYYKLYLDNITTNNIGLDELEKYLDNVPKKNDNDYYFILTDNTTIISDPDGNISNFFIKYADTYLEETNGRVYEYYAVEEEGFVKEVTLTNGETGYVGFKYSTTTNQLSMFFITLDILAIIIYIIIMTIWSKSISKNISDVSTSLFNISKNQSHINNTSLPILSQDEIGKLTIAFNEIQDITKQNIKQIQDNQDLLIEKERLASLGQMIGGIAHNLKTPIMSISGALEGLTDLITEYHNSIEDPDVTPEDHHEIASDMEKWIEKIKNHLSYMSDVISAVKGQAVSFSNNQIASFTVEELIKQVKILMKHELSNSLTNLNISINVGSDLTLHGNINSLVQVINNMISNSIQAYGGKPNQSIDLTISKEENNVIISVKDYGCGMTKEVKDKLFKEMITTKGKNGTGLGLFMSHSNIRAHFNGNITFKSEEGKGTIFNIIIPL